MVAAILIFLWPLDELYGIGRQAFDVALGPQRQSNTRPIAFRRPRAASRRLQQAAPGFDRAAGAPSSNTAAAGASRLEHAATDQAISKENETVEGLPQQAAAAPSAYVEQLEKRIGEKDETIKFLQEELVDRRSQISGMKAIIDGQRQLLETINNNVAPVFGALAQLVRGKSDASDDIKATIVDETGTRDSQSEASGSRDRQPQA